MKHKVLKVHPKDNVIVALTNLSKGETISFEGADIFCRKIFLPSINFLCRI